MSKGTAGTAPLAAKKRSPADGRDPLIEIGDVGAGRDVNVNIFGVSPADRVYRPLIDNLALLEREWKFFADQRIPKKEDFVWVSHALAAFVNAGNRVCAARDEISALGDIDTRKKLDGICQAISTIKTLTETTAGLGGIALARASQHLVLGLREELLRKCPSSDNG